MKTIAFRLKKISGEFHKAPEGLLNVNSNFQFTDVNKQTSRNDKDIFGIDFVYTIKYDDIATLEFIGTIFVELNDNEMATSLEKEGKVNDTTLRTYLINTLLKRTHVEALHLEEKLGLPFHIQTPKVEPAPEKETPTQ